MGKRRRTRQTQDTNKESDTEHTPDPRSYDYCHNEIDAFHDRREKILINKGPLDVKPADSSSEDEVLGLDLAESDDSENDERIVGYKNKIRQMKQTARKFKTRDDIEEMEDDTEEGWGSKKSHYYGADVHDEDRLDIDEGEDNDQGGGALEEEKEALALQRKMAEQMEEGDFGLDAFVVPQPEEEGSMKEEKIQKDLSQMSRREKLELFRKESPEFFQLRDDFIEKMTVIEEVLRPMGELVKSGELPQGKASQYVDTRLHLYLNYCLNINFYMLLKSKQISVQSHPVIKRILQYRNLIKQLETVDTRMASEMDEILQKKAKGKQLDYNIIAETEKTMKNRPRTKQPVKVTKVNLKESPHTEVTLNSTTTNKKGPSKKVEHIETSGEREASLYYRQAHGLAGSAHSGEESGDDQDLGQPEEDTFAVETATEGKEFEGKRSITYEMAKNKGLMSKKKKLQRNPRVKHRMKYKKALVKRRSMVREAKLPLQPYGGELSGIRAGLKQGTKLQ